jgi:hypothetical protein
MTSDSTVEKLGELLKDNPQGILVSRDELAGWLMGLERQGREGEREFWLEGWAGTGRFDFDRIGRGTIHVDNLTLSLIGGIQPGKLSRWVSGAMSQGMEADGLVQRLQVLVWPDDFGEWKKATSLPNAQARESAFRIFETIANVPNLPQTRKLMIGASPSCASTSGGRHSSTNGEARISAVFAPANSQAAPPMPHTLANRESSWAHSPSSSRSLPLLLSVLSVPPRSPSAKNPWPWRGPGVTS